MESDGGTTLTERFNQMCFVQFPLLCFCYWRTENIVLLIDLVLSKLYFAQCAHIWNPVRGHLAMVSPKWTDLVLAHIAAKLA